MRRGSTGLGSWCLAHKKIGPKHRRDRCLGPRELFWALLLSLVLMQGEEVVELAIGELAQPALTGGNREIG